HNPICFLLADYALCRRRVDDSGPMTDPTDPSDPSQPKPSSPNAAPVPPVPMNAPVLLPAAARAAPELAPLEAARVAPPSAPRGQNVVPPRGGPDPGSPGVRWLAWLVGIILTCVIVFLNQFSERPDPSGNTPKSDAATGTIAAAEKKPTFDPLEFAARMLIKVSAAAKATGGEPPELD